MEDRRLLSSVSFSLQRITPLQGTAQYASWATSGDINGDGAPDVISVSRYDGKVAWYANDGHGNFGTQHVIGVVNFPTWVGTADIAGDGHTVVVVTSLDDNTVSWYHNDGHGNFGPRQIIADNLSQPYSATIAYVEGDSAPDVVVAYRARAPTASCCT